jgi:hypothetical protein
MELRNTGDRLIFAKGREKKSVPSGHWKKKKVAAVGAAAGD